MPLFELAVLLYQMKALSFITKDKKYQAELQIRRGKRNSLMIIFHITPSKHML